MNSTQQKPLMATSAAAAPSLLTQVGMAGSAAVITVSFIHPSTYKKSETLTPSHEDVTTNSQETVFLTCLSFPSLFLSTNYS